MDAVEITSTLSYDAERWYVGDPAVVSVTVIDADTGTPVAGSVLVAVVNEDKTTEDETETITDANGQATVSLTPTGAGFHEVWAHFKEGNYEGYHLVEGLYILPKSPIGLDDPVVSPSPPSSTVGQINFDFSEPDYSVTGATV